MFPEAYHLFDEIPAKLWLTQGFLLSQWNYTCTSFREKFLMMLIQCTGSCY